MNIYIVYTVDSYGNKNLIKTVTNEVEAMKIVNEFIFVKAKYKKVKI